MLSWYLHPTGWRQSIFFKKHFHLIYLRPSWYPGGDQARPASLKQTLSPSGYYSISSFRIHPEKGRGQAQSVHQLGSQCRLHLISYNPTAALWLLLTNISLSNLQQRASLSRLYYRKQVAWTLSKAVSVKMGSFGSHCVFFYGFSDSAIILKLITADVITAIVVDVKTKYAAGQMSLQGDRERGKNTTTSSRLSSKSVKSIQSGLWIKTWNISHHCQQYTAC